jgi:hypothetical protein
VPWRVVPDVHERRHQPLQRGLLWSAADARQDRTDHSGGLVVRLNELLDPVGAQVATNEVERTPQQDVAIVRRGRARLLALLASHDLDVDGFHRTVSPIRVFPFVDQVLVAIADLAVRVNRVVGLLDHPEQARAGLLFELATARNQRLTRLATRERAAVLDALRHSQRLLAEPRLCRQRTCIEPVPRVDDGDHGAQQSRSRAGWSRAQGPPSLIVRARSTLAYLSGWACLRSRTRHKM